MKNIFISFFCFVSTFVFAQNDRPLTLTPKQALEKLVQGNLRFAKDQSILPHRDIYRRESTLQQQKPFAVILGCSDSRVPPEILFDQGIGDLFIVRIAGNVVGPLELDSIEYATIYLGASLVMVLGHENCSAVKAVMAGQTDDIESIAQLISPTISQIRDKPGNTLENGIKQNVIAVVDHLKRTSVLSKQIEKGQVGVVGGYYNLESGTVSLLDTGTK